MLECAWSISAAHRGEEAPKWGDSGASCPGCVEPGDVLPTAGDVRSAAGASSPSWRC
jgi:hypothetical protein